MNFHTGPSIVSLVFRCVFFDFLIASIVSVALILDEWPTVPLLVLFERQDLQNPPNRTFSTRLLVNICGHNYSDELTLLTQKKYVPLSMRARDSPANFVGCMGTLTIAPNRNGPPCD